MADKNIIQLTDDGGSINILPKTDAEAVNVNIGGQDKTLAAAIADGSIGGGSATDLHITVGDKNNYSFGEAKANGTNNIAVGDGTVNINANNTLAIGGSSTGGNNIVIGGLVTGANSVAIGAGSTAANGAIAIGANTSAVTNAIAIHDGAVAQGHGSIAIGTNVIAKAHRSIAMLNGEEESKSTIAAAQYSMAIGNGVQTTERGINSVAIGNHVISSAKDSIIIGNSSVISGETNFLFGMDSDSAQKWSDITITSLTKDNGDGTGTIEINKNIPTNLNGIVAGDSFTVFADNFTYVFTAESRPAQNKIKFISWDVPDAVVTLVHKIVVIKRSTCCASGKCSMAFGNNVISDNGYQFTIGRYNKRDENGKYDPWNVVKPMFLIGNGVNENSRSNAFKILSDGKVFGGAYNGEGADYAEMFEWKDSNSETEDRMGYFVTLDGNKIIKANSKSNIIGVISATAGVIGDNPIDWNKRYVTDKWGNIIYEEQTIIYYEGNVKKTKTSLLPKPNPDYDASLPYVERSNRPEWAAVGLLGKLRVRQDGTLKVGDYCVSNDSGIATKSKGDSGYYVMEVIDKECVKILFK